MSASHPDLLLFLSLPQPHNKLQTSKPLRIYFFGHEVLLPLTLTWAAPLDAADISLSHWDSLMLQN